MKKIILTENQFTNNILLREYKGEQLVLPFDGISRSYNYMQYVDYLQQHSLGKELKSKYHSIDDFKKTLDDDFWFKMIDIYYFENWCNEDDFYREEFFNYINKYILNDTEFTTEDICNEEDVWCAKQMLEIISEVYYDYDVLYDKFISIGKEIFDDFVNGFSEITKDGLIYVERSISIPDIFGHTNDLKNQYINKLNKEYRGNVGFCWSYQNGSAFSYNSKLGDKHNLILQGYTRIEDVEWESCIALIGMNEFELRIVDGGLVQITNIIADFNGSQKHSNLIADYPFVVIA